jgi:uncharacterized damage-inducible protein DinB
MEQSKDLGQMTVDFLRSRVASIFPAQIRTCVMELSEEQLWWRPNEKSNSVGNLVLHVSGSMRHYLSRAIGGIEYERNRAAEFDERGPVAKLELVAIFDETIRQAIEVFDSFDTSRLYDATEEPNYYPAVLDQLLGVAMHLATHAGQILYITKMLKEGSIDELWIRAHRGKEILAG